MTFSTILSRNELNSHWAKVACLDPQFALDAKRFYEALSASELKSLEIESWNCNDSENYVLARSYLNLK